MTTRDGTGLRVLRWDAGGAPRFLLVHGLASNALTWAPVGDRLHERGHAVAAVDLRGHGESDRPDHGYDFATMATDLVDLLDALGWERAVVAGQSTGGNLAVELAATAPGRVAGVAGVDGGAIELRCRWRRWRRCARDLAPPPLEGTAFDDLREQLVADHPDWSVDAIEATLANFERRPDGRARPRLTRERHLRILRALWEHLPSRVLGDLDTPVLLIPADTGDHWVETKRAEMARASGAGRHVRVRWFSPADHDVHLQQPDELAELLHDSF